MNHISDLVIIGGGVIGCAVARELSRYDVSVTLLEQGADVAEGSSKANSGIVHSGYDALPGTLKARYNVEGADMMPGLCESMGVPYARPGALVLGFSEEDRETLSDLLDRGNANGVHGLRIIEKDEILSLEPNVSPEVVCALLSPTSGIVSPYELTFAFADDAALNGVEFRLNTEVCSVTRQADGSFLIVTGEDTFTAGHVINCAGASSAWIHNSLSSRKVSITHRRGQYALLDHPATAPFTRTIFQCPSKMGKGVLVSPTVHGNVLLGPTAEDIEDPSDTATTQFGLDEVLNKVRLSWPGVSTRTNITNFSGVRAHESGGDFIIGPVEGCPGAYEAIGIESPGLSASPAIARALVSTIAADLGLVRKETVIPYTRPDRPFNTMTRAEQASAIAGDPLHGNIICRCEEITEAEIIAAIRRPVGARSIDAVKRRTRAGMGRCQGGFCVPRVAAIISRETGIPLENITKNGGKSYLLTGTLTRTAERSDNK